MGGRSTTSVLNRPEFRVKWRDVTQVSRDLITGMTEDEAKAISRHERPLMVFVYNDELDEESRFEIESASAFLDDKVAVGARYFDCVRIDLESAKGDRVLKEHVGRANSLVFVRPNYEVAEKIFFKGVRVNARKVFGDMCKTLRLDYENCARKAAKEMRDIQKERYDLQREQAEVAEIDEDISEEESPRRREKLIEKRDELQDELDKQFTKLSEAEKKLFELKAKTES